MLQPRGINIESVLLKAVMLPELLKASIEQKVAAQQDAQRMEFVLQKEPQEAERKVIEASTGPNTSSCASEEAGETWVNSVGG